MKTNHLSSKNWANVSFAMIAVLILFLGSYTFVVIKLISTMERKKFDNNIAIEGSNDKIEVEKIAIERKIASIAEVLILEMMESESDFKGDDSEILLSNFNQEVDNYLNGLRFSYAGFNIIIYNYDISLVVAYMNLDDITLKEFDSISNVNMIDTAHTKKYDSVNSPSSFKIVGKLDFKVLSSENENLCYLDKSTSIDKDLNIFIPFLINKMDKFQNLLQGQNSEFDRLMKYILTTIAQMRVLDGYGQPRIQRNTIYPNNIMIPATSIITKEDIELSTRLSIAIICASNYRTIDKDIFSYESITDSNVLIDIINTYIDRGNTIDAADIMMLYHINKDENLRIIELYKLLSQALFAIVDQASLHYYKYFNWLDINRVKNAIETYEGVKDFIIEKIDDYIDFFRQYDIFDDIFDIFFPEDDVTSNFDEEMKIYQHIHDLFNELYTIQNNIGNNFYQYFDKGGDFKFNLIEKIYNNDPSKDKSTMSDFKYLYSIEYRKDFSQDTEIVEDWGYNEFGARVYRGSHTKYMDICKIYMTKTYYFYEVDIIPKISNNIIDCYNIFNDQYRSFIYNNVLNEVKEAWIEYLNNIFNNEGKIKLSEIDELFDKMIFDISSSLSETLFNYIITLDENDIDPNDNVNLISKIRELIEIEFNDFYNNRFMNVMNERNIFHNNANELYKSTFFMFEDLIDILSNDESKSYFLHLSQNIVDHYENILYKDYNTLKNYNNPSFINFTIDVTHLKGPSEIIPESHVINLSTNWYEDTSDRKWDPRGPSYYQNIYYNKPMDCYFNNKNEFSTIGLETSINNYNDDPNDGLLTIINKAKDQSFSAYINNVLLLKEYCPNTANENNLLENVLNPISKWFLNYFTKILNPIFKGMVDNMLSQIEDHLLIANIPYYLENRYNTSYDFKNQQDSTIDYSYNIDIQVEDLTTDIYINDIIQGRHYTDPKNFNSSPFLSQWDYSMKGSLKIRSSIGKFISDKASLVDCDITRNIDFESNQRIECSSGSPLYIKNSDSNIITKIDYTPTHDFVDESKIIDKENIPYFYKLMDHFINGFYPINIISVFDRVKELLDPVFDTITMIHDFVMDIEYHIMNIFNSISIEDLLLSYISDIIQYLIKLLKDTVLITLMDILDNFINLLQDILNKLNIFTLNIFGFIITFEFFNVFNPSNKYSGIYDDHLANINHILQINVNYDWKDIDINIVIDIIKNENIESFILLNSITLWNEYEIIQNLDPFMSLSEHIWELNCIKTNHWQLDLFLPELDDYETLDMNIPIISPPVPTPLFGIPISVSAGATIKYNSPLIEGFVINEIDYGNEDESGWIEIVRIGNIDTKGKFYLTDKTLQKDQNGKKGMQYITKEIQDKKDWNSDPILIIDIEDSLQLKKSLQYDSELLTTIDGFLGVGDGVRLYKDDVLIDETPLFSDIAKDDKTWQRKYSGSLEWIYYDSNPGETNDNPVELDLKGLILSLLKECFEETKSEIKLDISTASIDTISDFIMIFADKLYHKIINLISQIIIELVIYIDFIFGLLTGIRLSLGITGEGLSSFIDWMISCFRTLINNMKNPSNLLIGLPNINDNIINNIFIRINIFGQIDPNSLVGVSSGIIPFDLKLNVMAEFNLPTFMNVIDSPHSTWRIYFGVYISGSTNSLSKSLFDHNEGNPDIWIIKGAIYKIPGGAIV